MLAGSTGSDPELDGATDRLTFVASRYDYDDADILLWSDAAGGFVDAGWLARFDLWQLHWSYRGPVDELVCPIAGAPLGFNADGGSFYYNVENEFELLPGAVWNLRADDGLWVDYGTWMQFSLIRPVFHYPVAARPLHVAARTLGSTPGLPIVLAFDFFKWLCP